ncbi:MAG: YgiQ family radical SAM protein [Spirochaetales bacterium]|nr:YgiQ family radical SAM protein [Spirochaetales bacterium]
MSKFLPITKEELQSRGIDEPDFILVTGDAYVDHPSFGIAVIGRLLESRGYTVAVLSRPNAASAKSFRVFGRPRLGFLVTSGNIDSMVSNYTAAKKNRSDDLYAPGGRGGGRPDRACITYSIRIREAFGDVPVILGGLEASLRRLAHYDYWTDKVRRSILLDSKADLVVYGMGERAILEIAAALKEGTPAGKLTGVRGTVCRCNPADAEETVILPSFEEITKDKRKYAESFRLQYANNDGISGRVLVEPYADGCIRQNPPSEPLTTEELDEIHGLPFQRTYHPAYESEGGVPAIKEVQFSIISTRGCYGDCGFCSLTFHQGRMVRSRGDQSILQEAEIITKMPGFKGYIHDVGGPTANFRSRPCAKSEKRGICADRECIGQSLCKNLEVEHKKYLALLRKIRALPGIKKVFIRSGVRFDYLIADPDTAFFNELCEHHVSGQLKVAPEHISDTVLKLMNKPSHSVYIEFKKRYDRINKKLGKKQFLVPYYISGHPGSGLKEAIELAEYFRDNRLYPEQVQDFYPTPGTLSTCMYHTGLNPLTMEPVYVARDMSEKAMQRALLQYKNPGNYELVRKALLKAGRKDLIGYDKRCLLRPVSGRHQKLRGKPRRKGASD